jgi:hypothetical protein
VIVRRASEAGGGADSSQHGEAGSGTGFRGTEQPPSVTRDRLVFQLMFQLVRSSTVLSAGGSQQEQQQAPNSGSPQSAPQLPVVDSGAEKPFVNFPEAAVPTTVASELKPVDGSVDGNPLKQAQGSEESSPKFP